LGKAVCEAEVAWITYDTPVDDSDFADSDFVLNKTYAVLPMLKPRALVLVSSQIPVGSISKLEFEARKIGRTDLLFAYSPENLRLGQALKLFAEPDRVVCGIRTEEAKDVLRRLWSPITDRIEWMKVESAEMTKHTLNAFLATSIAFTNEIATLCESVGADAKEVERGLKTETRVGRYAYVSPGLAFAGGTLARDLTFLSSLAEVTDNSALLITSVRTSNEKHKMWVIDKLREHLGNLYGKKITLLGLTYKPGTDTLRRSLSLECARHLFDLGAQIHAHDPVIDVLPDEWSGRIFLAKSPLEALRGSHAMVLCTNWDDYGKLKEEEILEIMNRPLIIDPMRFLFESFGKNPHIEYMSVGFSTAKKGARYFEY
jgi:UDPglucose 6-dehydrogenase